MFLGKYASKLDQESRFVAPSNYGGQLVGGAFLIRGFDRNLVVLNRTAFEEVCRRISSQNIADPLTRLLLRLILSSAHELEPDQSGRISIPGELKEFADIGDDILLIGQGDYFELWQPSLWEKQELQLRDALTNSSRFSALMVATR
ncbi:MAG: division/cell wall cluster transcriptional repressor MraZ [Bacteroidota bacterium]